MQLADFLSAHRRRMQPRLAAAGHLAAALLALSASSPALAKPAWDQVANIKKTALQLVELQTARGALGAFQHIASCYRTHELASSYNAGFEGCMVLDYIHSKFTAAVYTKVPEADRKRMNSPDPEALVAAMSQRLAHGFRHYSIADAEAKGLIALIEKHGVPEYTKARFPNADAPDGKAAPKKK